MDHWGSRHTDRQMYHQTDKTVTYGIYGEPYSETEASIY